MQFRYYSKEHNEELTVLCIDMVNDCFWVLPTSELEGGTQIEVKGLDKMEQFIDFHWRKVKFLNK